MKRPAVIEVQFKSDGSNPRAETTIIPCSTMEIDIEFEQLEEKTALQSETSYLDMVLGHF